MLRPGYRRVKSVECGEQSQPVIQFHPSLVRLARERLVRSGRARQAGEERSPGGEGSPCAGSAWEALSGCDAASYRVTALRRA